MGYYDGYNADLLRFIPPDAKTVLEIGCGEGALCAAYRRVNPGCEYFGIELDSAAKEIAGNRNVFSGIEGRDIETYDEDEWSIEFDCLILGDILEHLRNPWKTLKTLTQWLSSGAQVLACIPNVQHWTVIRDLLDGKWNYVDSGLLDRTHLRFFTLKSIREMFDAAGLQVFEIVGRDLFNDGAGQWFEDCFDEVSGESNLPREWRAYQYIVRAIKPSMVEAFKLDDRGYPDGPHIVPCPIPKLHIHAVTAEDCCARPRILEPFAMLGTIPGVICRTHEGYQFGSMVEAGNEDDCDKIVIQQRFRIVDMRLQRMTITKGRILIAEIDDLPEAIGMDPMALKAVHAIQCSTEALAEVCRQYNPNVMVFENQIADLPPFHERSKDPMEVNLFFGAQNRQEDWKPIMPALNRILNNTLGVTMNVVHDREFFDAIESDRKQFFEFAPYAEYRGILSFCDIALLPLEDTPFNRCKSDIKKLECAAEGVLCVCTGSSDLGNGVPGYHLDDEVIAEGLNLLIRSPERRAVMVERAYAYVRDNRLLSQHYRKQYEWYQSLLSSKPELDRQLMERVPELSARLALA